MCHQHSVFCLLALIGLARALCPTSSIPPFGLDQQMRNYHIDQFKHAFLKELNMRRAPTISPESRRFILGQLSTMDHVSTRLMKDEEEAECGETSSSVSRGKRSVSGPLSEDPQQIIVERILSSRTNTPDRRFEPNPARSYFHLNDTPVQPESIARATLHLFLDTDDQAEIAELKVYKFINEYEVAAQPVVQKRVRVDEGGRAYADVTKLVRKWVHNATTNFGILVRVESNSRSVLNRTSGLFNDTENILLHLEFANGGSSTAAINEQSERTEQLCTYEQGNRNCCRYPLEVALEEVGFGFVISPKRVNIFHCSGDCPFGHLLTSRHAHMMQQASMFLDDDRPHSLGPCCVPTEFQNLTILYMPNEYTVKETTMVNMIALRCGCS